MTNKVLNDYRFFDPHEIVGKIAYELYESVRNLPIISPHGHVDARILAENEPFPDPAELIVIPDHYIYRMLYSQGIQLESLGVPSQDGTPVERDHRKIWQLFADHFYLFFGTPTGVWLAHEFEEVFGVEERLNGTNAMRIYDHMAEKLQTREFRPRSLFERFGLEVLTTTDAPGDSLQHHKTLQKSDLKGKVIPCFRPDPVVNIGLPGWKNAIRDLSKASGIEVRSYKKYIEALEKRREYFKSMGAVSTDQGVESPYAHRMSPTRAEAIFKNALRGKATEKESREFTANMLMEMARMSVEDGLVMQIHAGAMRNHNIAVFKKFGLDKGGDIPVQTEYTRNMHELLNTFGNKSSFTVVVFTLDESTYSRELAPLAGHYPAMRLGAPWWFHDSIQGMTRYRERVLETAGVYNTVGFTDDTRAFVSIPARHDLARRIDSNFLAGQVARHIMDKQEAAGIVKDLAYGLAKKTYKL